MQVEIRLLISRHGDGEIILGYLDGSNTIPGVLNVTEKGRRAAPEWRTVTETQVATAGPEDEWRPRATEPAASTAGNSEKRDAL